MRRVAVSLILAASLVAAGQAQTPVRLTGPTDEQTRIAHAEVGRLVTLLKLEPGMSIADVGAGLGAWSLRFAQFTGGAGHVYATDIDEVPLAVLRTLAAKQTTSKMTVIKGAADSTNLPDECCHAILTRNVYHYLIDPEAMNRSFAAALKPGGRLAVATYPPRPNSTLPPGVPANRGGVGIPPEIVEREVGAVLQHVITVPNWSPEDVPDWVPKEIGRPFVVIFEKAK